MTFDLLTLKVVSESHVTWATSMPILVFLGLSVLDLGPMYATDRQTSDSQTSYVRQTSDSIIMPNNRHNQSQNVACDRDACGSVWLHVI